jgi:hypothetical protein
MVSLELADVRLSNERPRFTRRGRPGAMDTGQNDSLAAPEARLS